MNRDARGAGDVTTRYGEEARRRGVAKSALVRKHVEGMPSRQKGRKPLTCLNLVSDLVGSQPGPKDASSNQAYLEEAVEADHTHARKLPG